MYGAEMGQTSHCNAQEPGDSVPGLFNEGPLMRQRAMRRRRLAPPTDARPAASATPPIVKSRSVELPVRGSVEAGATVAGVVAGAVVAGVPWVVGGAAAVTTMLTVAVSQGGLATSICEQSL